MAKLKKQLFRPIHLETIIVVIVYSIISYLILIWSLSHPNIIITFLIPLLFGVLSSIIFLYLFSHQEFFHFAKNLEKIEKKNQKKFLKKFLRFGKFITCITISFIGGPIPLALAVRFLFPQSKYKYHVAVFANIISTLLFVTSAKGLLQIIF